MDANHRSALREKHGRLEQQIADESRRPAPDELLIHELKKQKLKVKEELTLA